MKGLVNVDNDRHSASSLCKRRNFLLAGISSAVVYPLTQISSARLLGMILPDTIPMRAAAPHMARRTNAIRLDFVNTHMNPSPRKSIPLAKIFHTASMRPTDLKKAEKLFSREDLKWQGDRLISSSSEKLTAPFRGTLCSLPVQMSVTFPKVIDILVSYQSETLAFTFNRLKTDPILFTLGDPPQCGDETPALGLQQVLTSLTVSPKEVVITTTDKNQESSNFELTLDLVSSEEGRGQAAKSLLTSFLRRIAFLPVLLVTLLYAGCCKPGDCPPPPPPVGETRCPVTTKNICLNTSGPPAGFVIVDFTFVAGSDCGGDDSLQPNTWTVECIDEKAKGCTMNICATDKIPEGWVVKRRERSAAMCWVGIGSATENIYTIERTGNKPASPRCGTSPTPSGQDSKPGP